MPSKIIFEFIVNKKEMVLCTHIYRVCVCDGTSSSVRHTHSQKETLLIVFVTKCQHFADSVSWIEMLEFSLFHFLVDQDKRIRTGSRKMLQINRL